MKFSNLIAALFLPLLALVLTAAEPEEPEWPVLVPENPPGAAVYHKHDLSRLTLSSAEPLTSRIVQTPSGPQLEINGKIFYPVITDVDINDNGTLSMPLASSANMFSVIVRQWEKDCNWWPSPGVYDFSCIDRQVEKILSLRPDALMFMRIALYMPGNWEETTEMAAFEDGEIGNSTFYSFASPKAREVLAEAVQSYIEHCENAPYADRIAGYVLESGRMVEWMGWNNYESALTGKYYDYSPASQIAFSQFLREEFPTLDPDAGLPFMEERFLRDGDSVLLHPARHLRAIACNYFYSRTIADTLISQAQHAKKVLNNRKVIGAFYGYSYDLLSMYYAIHLGGHADLARVLESGAVDFMISPPSYQYRNLGDTAAEMKPFTSLNRHNVMSFIEDDTRTHACVDLDSAYLRNVNSAQSREVTRRNIALSVSRLQPIDLLGGAHFGIGASSAAIDSDISAAAITAEHAIANQVSRQSDVALVVSERALDYLPLEKRHIPFAKTQRYNKDGIPVPGDVSDTRFIGPLVSAHRSVLARSGAAVDYLLAEDLDLDQDCNDYKLWIFTNIFAYDEKFLDFVESLRQKECTILWLYAPGIYSQHTASTDNMTQLTGFEFRQVDGPILPVVEMLSGDTQGVAAEPVEPLFHVLPTPGVYVSGNYLDTDLAALAERTTGNCREIFCGAFYLDSTFFRDLACEAGVWLYSDSNDPMDANSGTFTLHARYEGPKTVYLPVQSDVIDVFNRRKVAENVNTFTFDAPLHSSHLFYYGPDGDGLLKKLNGEEN